MALKVLAIAAMDEERVIGKEGGIPWKIPEDLRHFAKLTTGHTVLMGRKTYDSLKPPYKPLPDRENIVVTRQPERLKNAEVTVCSDPAEYIKAVRGGSQLISSEKLWIVGGAEIYCATLPDWDEVHLTLVHGKHAGDTFFPEFEDDFQLVKEDQKNTYSFLHYVRNT